MSWPTPQDYSEAVQNPVSAFPDVELKKGQVEVNKLGLPKPCSGAFAVVFKIKTSPQPWAVKCFTSEILDQQRRYEAISTYLAKVALPYTVPFTYMQNGIKINGKDFPLLKMQWVQGESLNSFVARSYPYPETLFSLAKVWTQMMADLKSVNIAHGDLQHGNILVVGDQLCLIDYDGMYVPTLAGKPSNEIGHRNYQLPSRTAWDYGPYTDNFSAWVIYVSFVALAVHPELWTKYRGGDECLLFRKEDYVSPESSPLIAELCSTPNTQLRLLIELFTSLFALSAQDIPSLDGNITPVTVDRPRSNWWVDHSSPREENSQEKTVEPNQAKVAEPTIPDPGWIVDSLMNESPVKALTFQGQTKQVRILILGSLALLALTKLVGEVPMSEFTAVASCVFGLNILLCFFRYKRDPSVAEYAVFKKETTAFLRQVREHQTLMDSIMAERVRMQEQLDSNIRAIEAKKKAISANFLENRNKALANLNSQILKLNQRRSETSSSETKSLNSIQATLGSQIVDLDRRIAALNQKESDEKSKMLTVIQNSYVQNYLSNHFLANSSIPGIGAAYKSRLVSCGFATAANINWSVSQVSGIGTARQSALMNWRDKLEFEAKQSAPGLSAQVRLAIENKYRDDRQILDSNKRQLKKQFDDQVAGVRHYFSNERQALIFEEQQLRTANSQFNTRLQQENDAQVATFDAEISAAKNQAAPSLNEVSERLRNAQKQVFAIRWQCAKKANEGRRFAALRFRDYCRKIVVP